MSLLRRRMMMSQLENLVNLFELRCENITLRQSNAYALDIENGIRFEYEGVRDSWALLNVEVKPNTTYTVEFDCRIENNNTIDFTLFWCNYEGSGFEFSNVNGIKIDNSELQDGHGKLVFKTPDTEAKIRLFLAGTRNENNVTGWTEYKNFKLIEGII